MLIPIVKPHEKVIYEECQKLKDLYKDGKVVGTYAASYISDQWFFVVGKTILKDDKIETIDKCVVCGEEAVDWEAANLKFFRFLGDVKYVINYAESGALDADKYNIEYLDIERLAMWCQYYFRYRGLDTSNIEYTRCIFEYGEGIDGIDMYDELTGLIETIFSDYKTILEQDKAKKQSE